MQSLECSPDLELEALRLIFGLALDREAHADLERTDRRQPRQTETGRVTHVAQLVRLTFGEHVTVVKERKQANGAVHARTRQRENEFHVADELAGAADSHAIGVARAQRAGFVT